MPRLRTAVLLCLWLVAPAAGADPDRRCRSAIGIATRRALATGLGGVDRCHARRVRDPGTTCVVDAAAVRRALGALERKCRGAELPARYPDGDPLTALVDAIVAEIDASERTLARAAGGEALPGAARCRRAVDRARRTIWIAAARGAATPGKVAAAITRACGRIAGGATIGACDPLPGCLVDAATISGRAIAAVTFGALPGAAARFDPGADLATPERFYDLPYPSDLRLRSDGTPDLTGYPIASTAPIPANLKSIAERRPAFPAIPVAYFRFSAALAARVATDTIPAHLAAPLLLLDVDPISPARGTLFPLIANTPPADPYVPEHLLAVATVPGTVLPAGRRYAFVVRRAVADAAGAPLGVPFAFLQLRAGGVPAGARGDEARRLYAPLWETLAALGVTRDDVAAATVFTVGDVVAQVADLSSRLAARDPVSVQGLVLDEVHPRFCELRGVVTLPQYQRGTPDFDSAGDFVVGGDGLPVVQRTETAPVVMTLPRRVMPAGGYRMVLYVHGSGGVAAQVVDRGPTATPDGDPAAGEGPAHVLAAHGLATVGSALPLNPERLPGAISRAYLNLGNLAAYPYTFQQGTIEQRLLLDALGRLAIDPAVVAACPDLALPAGETHYRLRTDVVGLQGQSMGAQYSNMVGAVDARVGAAVPTGSGGLFSLVVLEASLVDGIDTRPFIPSLVGTTQPLTHIHPALHLLELAWESAETVVYAARLARDPLAGSRARALYLPISPDDPGFPNPIYTAMALASGTQQAGEVLFAGLQTALATAGRDGLASYPVTQNQRATDGTAYTGVVVQYAADGILDGHHIFAQRDEVKSQYGCFFETFFKNGTATVPAPLALGTPCPE